jgi:hypothetical protein
MRISSVSIPHLLYILFTIAAPNRPLFAPTFLHTYRLTHAKNKNSKSHSRNPNPRSSRRSRTRPPSRVTRCCGASARGAAAPSAGSGPTRPRSWPCPWASSTATRRCSGPATSTSAAAGLTGSRLSMARWTSRPCRRGEYLRPDNVVVIIWLAG